MIDQSFTYTLGRKSCLTSVFLQNRKVHLTVYLRSYERYFFVQKQVQCIFSFVAVFISESFLIRPGLVTAAIEKTDFFFLSILRIFAQGLLYDLGVSAFLALSYTIFYFFCHSTLSSPGSIVS
ncbi:hypothetical protein SAMN05421820_108238 [Pedobacter steynii]|uniref:Uncharacterized protein n=1 Tax=Pedobacter steynii TaxID=430522 RepID=A0A1H0CWI3_9SPHI|nr:hypothetical protein SAMN05421820_108238 [Pedobacter steynii]